MKENKLTIRINKPVSEVFEFTINPQNTPRWIDSIIEESIDTKEIKVGTRYTSVDKDNFTKNSYRVVKFENNRVFELQSLLFEYHVRYTYIPISENETELEYFEWDAIDLATPLTQDTLEKLKNEIELTDRG